MKKVLAFVLAAIMVLSLAACNNNPTQKPDDTTTKAQDTTTKAPDKETDKPEPPKEAIHVKYYCTIGAYLDRILELVDEFNKGEGVEKGVYIDLESEINDSSTVMENNMAAGNYPDIFTSASPQISWYSQGWYKNLYEVDDPDIQQLIKNAQPYIDASPGTFSVVQDHFLCNIPLEVLPIKMPVNLDLFEEAKLELPKTWDDVVKAAEAITNLNKEGTRGYGWCIWSAVWRRLTFKATLPSARKAWWDPNTATYDWSQYTPVLEAIREMYKNGWMLGADDLHIDPIRSEFSAGHVGMFMSPSYDYAVFTNQFPATCNWTFIDPPVFREGNKYKGAYFSRGGHAICALTYDVADQAKKDAIEIAYAFIEGDYFIKECALTGGMIPFPGRFPDLKMPDTIGPQFAIMADTEGYYTVPLYPDSAVGSFLDGDNYATVFDSYMHGNVTLEDALTDLSTRYNAAYQKAKLDPDTAPKLQQYEYEYIFNGK